MRIANARMYSVNAEVADSWRTLLQWVVERASVAVEVIDYPAPQPLPALWDRPDLACVFMCGFPLSRADARPVVLAAPVPSPPAYAGRPVYWTNLVVRADGPIRSLDGAYGKRIAFTTPDSQSGYQALRSFFAPHARTRGSPLFAGTIGPLITPRRVVEAVLAGEADIGPVDSYAYDLMQRHENAWLAPLRVIARTGPTPIPSLVGAPGLPDDIAQALRAALLSVAKAPELAATRDALLLHGFAPPSAADYGVLLEAAEAATALGYPRLE